MPSVEAQPARSAATEREVTLVDTDIHPMMLERSLEERLAERWWRRYRDFGVRIAPPPAIYPRVRNSGYRVDAWPEGGFPGQRPRAAAPAAARRTRRGLRAAEPAPGSGLGSRRTGAGGSAVPRAQRLDPRGMARSRAAPAGLDLRAVRTSGPGRSRDRAVCGRPALRPRPATRRARSRRSATGGTGRSTRPLRTPACRWRSTPPASSSTAARAGPPSTWRSTSGTATSWARGS